MSGLSGQDERERGRAGAALWHRRLQVAGSEGHRNLGSKGEGQGKQGKKQLRKC